jgi:ketosteroid isomerase-like protein
MSTPTSPIDVALAYHRAWTAGDLDTAMSLVADEVVFDAPAGVLTGLTALRAFMGPFAATLTSARLLSAHGGEGDALIMYDTATPAVASAPAAELYTVRDGRITAGRIIFDRLAFALARGDVTLRTS